MYIDWCNTLDEYCKCLYNQILDSDTIITDKENYFELLHNKLESYLNKVTAKDIVLIKTSVTGKRSKWHEVQIELLEDVIRICRKLCSNNAIYVCDGPAYSKNLEKEYKRLGWVSLFEKYNVSILDFNYDKIALFDNLWPVSKSWFGASKIINLCKAKTHKRFGVSLSTKNLLGILSGNEMGFPKLSNKHENVPKFLFLLLKESNTIFNIIDGVGGVEGNGPMHGSCANSNFIVMGTSGYMCDARAIIEMGFHPAVVPAMIIPLVHKEAVELNKLNYDIKEFRQTKYDFLPHLACSWMYCSLNKNSDTLKSIYLNLLRGIQECWINYPKNM